MWSFMESTKPVVFTTGNTEGIERVKKGNGKYAFLMESTTIEYVIERECDTTQIGGLLDSKGYGIALPPGKSQHLENCPKIVVRLCLGFEEFFVFLYLNRHFSAVAKQ